MLSWLSIRLSRCHAVTREVVSSTPAGPKLRVSAAFVITSANGVLG